MTRFLVFIFLILTGILALSSFATSVNVVETTYQADYGTLTFVYFETLSGPSSATPGTNTATTQSSNSGSYQVARSSSAYLWSPQFSSSTTINQGTWILDLWASCTTSSTISISIYTTTSSGTIQSRILSSGTTGTISTTARQELSSFSGNDGAIPSAGYIEVVLTVSSAPRHCVIFWGNGQQTNFQVPYRTLSS
jgi:hypothetical protein